MARAVKQRGSVVTGIIDGDGHIFEHDEYLYPYLEHKYPSYDLRNYYLFPDLDGRRRHGRGPAWGDDAQSWVRFMDELGLATGVIYPTVALGLGFAREYDWVVDLAEAYNNFLSDKYLKVSPRLKAVALLPVHRPAEAAKELRRAVTELGMVGGLLPTPGLRHPYGETFYDPLYEEAQRLGVMLGVHGASHRVLGCENLFSDEHPRAAFILGHPFAQMTQFVSMVYGGVWDRFPNLRLAFLEASCGWVPYLLERLDRRAEDHGVHLGFDTVRNHPIYFHAELEDGATLRLAIEVIGDDRLIYASDFPHEGVDDITEGLHEFLEREDLGQTTKEKILRDNITALYRLSSP